MIEVSGMEHRYGPLTAVHEISFGVRRGEVLGLLGPNGAGKTTILRAVVGLLVPTRGQVRIDGLDLHAGPGARALLGYLPEQTPLYRELRVDEFLRFAARAKGVAARDEHAEIERVVELCGLEGVRRRLIGFCSRGYRQRIGLAQALIGDPPALVLDEPTVGLDPAQMVDVRERIATLARDKAVILSTHILPEAQRLCTRVLILDRGRRLAEDRPDALAAALGDAARLRLRATPAATARDWLRERPGVRRVETDSDDTLRLELDPGMTAAPLVRGLVEAGCEIEEVGSERLGLEDVFLRLVRHEEPAAAEPTP